MQPHMPRFHTHAGREGVHFWQRGPGAGLALHSCSGLLHQAHHPGGTFFCRLFHSLVVNTTYITFSLGRLASQMMRAFPANCSLQIQPFEPFSILGLETSASDADIKKAYRRLSKQYHPDKNPDPGTTTIPLATRKLLALPRGPTAAPAWYNKHLGNVAEDNKYFVDFISKAYQALTDPESRANWEKWGHPDGKQVTACLCTRFFCST